MSGEEAKRLHRSTPQWHLSTDGTRLRRRFEFDTFKEAMAFINGIADIAERAGHHPDIAIHWNQVNVELFTHKILGLHRNDFILAAKIDDLQQSWMDPWGIEGLH